jgi:L-lactate utilization protein LutB
MQLYTVGKSMAGANNYKEAKAEMEKHCQFVAKEIGRDWKKLGRKLKRITKTIIENIDDEFQSTEEKAYQVLMKWYQANGQAGATKEVLIKALQAIDKTSIVEELVLHRDHCDPSYGTRQDFAYEYIFGFNYEIRI